MRRFDPDKYYRPTDEQMRLIATKGTLAFWRSVGRGPEYVKNGARVLYHGAALNQYLDERVVQPVPVAA